MKILNTMGGFTNEKAVFMLKKMETENATHLDVSRNGKVFRYTIEGVRKVANGKRFEVTELECFTRIDNTILEQYIYELDASGSDKILVKEGFESPQFLTKEQILAMRGACDHSGDGTQINDKGNKMENEFIDRDEIRNTLEKQFSEIRKMTLSREQAETLLKSEYDVCDKVEPNSGNWQFAREMQDQFLTHDSFYENTIKPQYTPGPWTYFEVEPDLEQGHINITRARGEFPVASCRNNSEAERSHEENIANARLIAAAPLLLHALEAMLLAHPKSSWAIGAPGSDARLIQDLQNAAAYQAHLAIAKARGES